MSYVREVFEQVQRRDAHQEEFHQAVWEVLHSIEPVVERHPVYRQERILERIVEPERVVMFRVPWTDDQGTHQVNRGFRVGFNSSLGPLKGGLRFHPSVTLSIIKFLGFEQIFKNALTTRPIGGAKGGSDFDPKGKSDAEVMRFCQSFMTGLWRVIGPNEDVPAGDIGVGGRELGYMYGQYKRLTHRWDGALTGKGYGWGGSLMRPEATGYGLVYFLREMLAARGQEIAGKTCIVSGSGNVAQYAIEKLLDYGGKTVAFSDSSGFVYDPDGVDREKLAWLMELKNVRRGRVSEYALTFPRAEFHAGEGPWHVPCQVALPSATENEIDDKAAQSLVSNGCIAVAEGANMPSTPGAIMTYLAHDVAYGPGKAANAGGVATSALEMTQNAQFETWTREEVDTALDRIMTGIHAQSAEAAAAYDAPGNLFVGANIAGFLKVANAMLDLGLV